MNTPTSSHDVPPARMRVIIDNDFSGDPDDLWQLAHHVLSPSVDIRFVIGSHLRPDDFFDPSPQQATNAAQVATDLLTRMGRGDLPVLTGSETALASSREPRDTPAARAIIDEAMRDTELPLYYCAGAGLTDLASALLLEPDIAGRLTLVWIGGGEYPGLAAAPPGASGAEYNLAIDIAAASTVFAFADLRIWQVPRDAYRQVLVGFAELETTYATSGPLGAYLTDALLELRTRASAHGLSLGETYILGDSPLVLLTALQSSFEADPSSSDWDDVPRPTISADGSYQHSDADAGRVRLYRRLDVRLLLDDLQAKLRLFDRDHR